MPPSYNTSTGSTAFAGAIHICAAPAYSHSKQRWHSKIADRHKTGKSPSGCSGDNYQPVVLAALPPQPQSNRTNVRQPHVLLRKATVRTAEAKWQRIRQLLDAFPQHEFANHLGNSEYASINTGHNQAWQREVVCKRKFVVFSLLTPLSRLVIRSPRSVHDLSNPSDVKFRFVDLRPCRAGCNAGPDPFRRLQRQDNDGGTLPH